ncbi:hypothetical protein AMAG_10206 [Allomyces macrogynus ATCC 38327]|uniref:Uncharacterized protein n=1 Tax=Allomyces macrogynus (strain ATCC 38327) TaxID=578462 RepID=A0A0L0SQQ7_ALLM3|nr:hypothetical protein AMAG_10206 [Allomyces macrogynus ATCC 38327]|eukprot:KNE64873.1 hypothetical protein AMAG_10206 [Allomyces macrogynus ATCC 38327]
MHAANQVLLLALAAILAIATLATAAPVSENPPNDPLVVFYWCRGLEGREDGFLLLQTQPPYSDWTPAWNVKLYRDWGCKGEPVAELNSYHSLQGLAYPDPADPKKPLVIKSLAFVPAPKTQP